MERDNFLSPDISDDSKSSVEELKLKSTSLNRSSSPCNSVLTSVKNKFNPFRSRSLLFKKSGKIPKRPYPYIAV